jgi:hypothetical protein
LSNETIAALWGAAVGAILAGVISCVINVWLDRRRTRNEAGANLRSIFASALAEYELIQGKSMNEIDTLLKSNLPAQATAIEVFRYFVTCCKKEEYEKAWQDYHRPPCANGSIFMLEYVPSADEPETAKKLFKQRIHAILQFTK